MNRTFNLFVLLFLFVLSGCNTYYYTTVKSYENQLSQNEDGSYTNEKNDIVINYSFQNGNGDLIYDVTNNSDDPYLVDWERSVLVVENEAIPIRSDKARLNGKISTTTYYFGENVGYGSGSVSGRVVIPQDKLFITPHSKSVYSPVSLIGTVINRHSIRNAFGTNDEIERLNFEENHAPLKFRSYVTLINDNDKTQTVFEDTFYISDYFRSGSSKIFKENSLKRGNTFYFVE